MFRVLFLAISLFVAQASFGQLEVDGFAHSNEVLIRDAQFDVYNEDSLMYHLTPGKKGDVIFDLPFDGKYHIVVYHPDYNEKEIIFDTKVPRSAYGKKYKYKFKVDLTKKAHVVTTESLDLFSKPIALVKFYSDKFNYDARYTKDAMKQLEQLNNSSKFQTFYVK